MTFELIDIPNMHLFGTKQNQDFLFELSRHLEVEQLFQTRYIRALLEYQLPPVKTQIIRWLLLPSLFYLALFNVYAIYLFESY